MNDRPTAPQGPGLRHQAGVRTGLRVAGAGARYAAGEYAPVVKDAAGYVSDGKGILGVGATGPYCRGCGTRNDADARFCDSCGASLA